MDGKQIAFVLIPLAFISILAEGFVGKYWFKRSLYSLRESLVGAAISMTSLLSGLAFAGIQLGVYVYVENNCALLTLEVTDWWTWLLALILYDFLYYWCHYFHHKVNFLWANHVVHHSGEDYNFILAIRIGALGTFTVWLFFIPMAIVGVPLEAYAVVTGMQIVYQYFLHTKLIPELGFLEKVFVTPSQHRVHHAKNPEYIDKNMGCFFVIWDRMFGTYQRELKWVFINYGVTTYLRKSMPESINLRNYIELFRGVARAGSVSEATKLILGTPKELQYKKDIRDGGSMPISLWDGSKIVLSYVPGLMLGYFLILNFDSLTLGELLIYVLCMVASTNLNGYRIEAKNIPLQLLAQIVILSAWVFILGTHSGSFLHPVIAISFAAVSLLVGLVETILHTDRESITRSVM